jgi:hypothetical protein
MSMWLTFLLLFLIFYFYIYFREGKGTSVLYERSDISPKSDLRLPDPLFFLQGKINP